jgi:hypothetical protein
MLRKINSFIIIACSLALASCRSQGWTQISPENSPPASGQGAVAFIDSSNTAILFGGISLDKWLNETWIWNGKTWNQVFLENPPSARAKLAMEYDKSRDKVVLFGGALENTLFNDTWEWDGRNWQLMNPAHKPPARCCHGMAYDDVNKNIILYGGFDPNTNVFLNDVWKWDGIDWTEISSSAPEMSGHAMTGFPVKNEIISVQTAGYGTWSWDGTKWKNLEIKTPPPRSEGKIAYESNHHWAIFFGGIADNKILNDTWVYNGDEWLDLSLSDNPAARYGHVLFYDSNRDSIILFGGIGNNNTRFGDTWELKLPDDLSGMSYDGDWKGTTSPGAEISFTVANNGISTMEIRAELEGLNCSSTLETKMETTINPTAEATGNFMSIHPIENGTFRIVKDNSSKDDSTYTVIGAFSSPDTASGTLEYSVNSGSCQRTSKFDWTAEKILE